MKKVIRESFLILIGCILAAFGTACFLLPNKLSSGGFAGIGTILFYFYEISMGMSIILLNIPIFIWGYFKLGNKFMIKTIIATTLYSKLIDAFENMVAFSHDNTLASIYGGILVGIGLAIVFKADASTGGTDLIAHIVQKYSRKISMSNFLVFIDATIIGVNLLAFKNIEIGLYSVIVIYIVGKMIDVVFEGINFCKVIYIISDKYEEILEGINKKADRGATGIYGKGGYSNKEKMIIMSVTKRRDIMLIKNIASEIDKEAFIIITDAREVFGLGFKK